MPEIALIPPYSRIKDMRNRHLQMFLPTCLRSEYADQYMKVAEQGLPIVLDNGMFEEDKPFPNTTLFELAARFKAREIVMPDVRNDSEQTLKTTREFLSQYWDLVKEGKVSSSLNFMAVIQGATIEDQKTLVGKLADVLPTNSVLGFPRRLTQTHVEARLNIMEHVVSTYGNRFPLHMLGLSREWPVELMRATRQFGGHLRGLDTSAPYCYAFHGAPITSQWTASGERPNHFFVQPENYFPADLVRYNIHVLQCWANSITPSPFKDKANYGDWINGL